MVLLGAIFKCLDPILILASIESTRTFFLRPPGTNDRSNQIKENMALGLPSDQYAALNAFREWRFIKHERGRQQANDFAFSNLMHVGALQMIEKTSLQMLEMLVEWDLVRDIPASMRYNHELGDPELNINSDVQPLVLALLATGLAPNLAVQTGPILLQTGADPKALIHPSSVNSGGSLKQLGPQRKEPRFPGAGPPGTLILFSTKSASSGGIFLRDTTIIGPMTGLMFAGKLESSVSQANILTVDDWLPFKFENGVCPQVRELTRSVQTVRPFSQQDSNLVVLGSNVVSVEGSESTPAPTVGFGNVFLQCRPCA
jgi:ATP-dependent RNA helicase DHX36